MDQRFKHKTRYHKTPEENIGKKLIDVGLDKDFLNITPKAQTSKAKINKWDHIKRKPSAQPRHY